MWEGIVRCLCYCSLPKWGGDNQRGSRDDWQGSGERRTWGAVVVVHKTGGRVSYLVASA